MTRKKYEEDDTFTDESGVEDYCDCDDTIYDTDAYLEFLDNELWDLQEEHLKYDERFHSLKREKVVELIEFAIEKPDAVTEMDRNIQVYHSAVESYCNSLIILFQLDFDPVVPAYVNQKLEPFEYDDIFNFLKNEVNYILNACHNRKGYKKSPINNI